MDPFEKPLHPIRVSSRADIAGRATKGTALFSGDGEKKKKWIHTYTWKKAWFIKLKCCFAFSPLWQWYLSDRELLITASLGVGSWSLKVTCRGSPAAQNCVS